jgi:DNA-binding MarR family transcriptional regulator
VPGRNGAQAGVEEMADQIFELTRLTWLSRTAMKKAGGAADLSNTEFLALDFLQRDGTMNVGQLQRKIGILPAQMSRVIKSLETRFGKRLVRCSINAQDKRKIDVALTEAGRRTLASFRKTRRAYCMEGLALLSERDRQEFMRILKTFQKGFNKRLREARAK